MAEMPVIHNVRLLARQVSVIRHRAALTGKSQGQVIRELIDIALSAEQSPAPRRKRRRSA